MATPSPSLWDQFPRGLARALFHEASDAILLIDAASHHVLDANPAAAKLVGASRESLIGSDANELLESDSCAPVVDQARGAPRRDLSAPHRDPRGPNPRPRDRVARARRLRAGASGAARPARAGRGQAAGGAGRGGSPAVRSPVPQHGGRFAAGDHDPPGRAHPLRQPGAGADVRLRRPRRVGRPAPLGDVRPSRESADVAEADRSHSRGRIRSASSGLVRDRQGRPQGLGRDGGQPRRVGRPPGRRRALPRHHGAQRREEALEASERFVRAITTASPHTTHVFDLIEGRKVWANRPIADDLGYTPEEVRHMGSDYPIALLHPDDRARLPAFLARWDTATDDEVLETEYRMRHADGTWRWFVGHDAVFSRDAGGRVRQVVGTAQDITARKRTENERRQSEERLASVIANSPGMAIQWFDGAGRVVLWNRASEEMFGYTAAEALGKTLDQLVQTPEEFAALLDTCAAIARTGEPIPPTEFAFRRHTGEPGVCLSTLFRIPGPGAIDWFVCMDIDITERKRAEEDRRKLEARVLQTQKTESLGVLAGGIAHDFNNLLTSVLGYASLAAMDLPPESSPRQMIGEIEKAAQRAAELTQQMLAYSGRGKFVVQVFELDGLVREMNTLLQTVVSKKAAVHLELAPAAIEADATQVRQVVMNLITNASDALGGQSGAVAIRTGTRHMTANALRSPYLPDGLPAGEYAYLEVADSGCGMTEETLTKIFDPFFTTKFTGRGLGLAAVLGIIRGHRGSLQIASAPGDGTTFRIFFPSVANPVVVSATVPIAAAPRGHGSVLVVDDEENVREYARRVLERAGFRVLLAKDGVEAVAAVREHRRAIRAVALDLTMPQMDGWEVASQLQRQDPDLPILLMSGYSEPDMTAHAGRTNIVGFVQKPFRPDDLIDRVYRLARDAR